MGGKETQKGKREREKATRETIERNTKSRRRDKGGRKEAKSTITCVVG